MNRPGVTLIQACREEVPLNPVVRAILRAIADDRAELRGDLVELAANSAGTLLLLFAAFLESVRLDALRHSHRTAGRAGPQQHADEGCAGQAGECDSDDEQENHHQTLMLTIRLITREPLAIETADRNRSTRPKGESYITFM